MIDDPTESIFMHLTGAGGTSVEKLICGQNWWHIEPETKHLTASQAKKRYADRWDRYFKFGLVRSPYDRAASLWHRFNPPGTFMEFAMTIPTAASVFDEPLDYIGKLEDISIVWPIICEIGGFGDLQLPHIGRSKGRDDTLSYFCLQDDHDLERFAEKHRPDLEAYNYPTPTPCFG